MAPRFQRDSLSTRIVVIENTRDIRQGMSPTAALKGAREISFTVFDEHLSLRCSSPFVDGVARCSRILDHPGAATWFPRVSLTTTCHVRQALKPTKPETRKNVKASEKVFDGILASIG